MKTLLIELILYFCAQSIYAQWTERDSIWLKNLLQKGDTIKLNPEFQKAIQEGNLINTEAPLGEPLLSAPQQLPILKDFSKYIQVEDTTKRNIDLKNLPSAVFWRHNIPLKKILPVYQSILEELRLKPLSTGSTAFAIFDIGEMTSRKAFIHKRNAKRDSTWKNYNNLPTLDIISKSKAFEKQQKKNSPKTHF